MVSISNHIYANVHASCTWSFRNQQALTIYFKCARSRTSTTMFKCEKHMHNNWHYLTGLKMEIGWDIFCIVHTHIFFNNINYLLEAPLYGAMVKVLHYQKLVHMSHSLEKRQDQLNLLILIFPVNPPVIHWEIFAYFFFLLIFNKTFNRFDKLFVML